MVVLGFNLLNLIWMVPAAVFLIILIFKSFVNVGPKQLATIEQKYIGKQMTDGRTIALRGEVGIQARVLGPGLHFIVPFIQKARKSDITVIGINQFGVVEAITGRPMPKERYVADFVECDCFQDGEAFLKNNGQKGPQQQIIPPGEYRINPLLFQVHTESVKEIPADAYGQVEALDGKPITGGRIMANPVECDGFQDVKAFFANGGEKGPQLEILKPGIYRINPFVFDVKIKSCINVKNDEVWVVTSIDGKPLNEGQIVARYVECNMFEDAKAFIANGGQKGPQVTMLTPGMHRLNTYLFKASPEKVTVVHENQVGLVEAKDGKPLGDGHIMASTRPECNMYQDSEAFLENGGQKGPQINVLTPGIYRVNPALFTVSVVDAIVVENGFYRKVTAMDGKKIPEGRVLATTVKGHKSFQDGGAFLANGGERGRQEEILMPGTYYINTYMFEVSGPVEWVHINADEVGVVTTLEGSPITDTNRIAAKEISLDVHSNFQDPAAFLKEGGEKGLQIPVLRAGSYAINDWFATVQKFPMANVKIGECAVVTSFVGDVDSGTSESSDKETGVNAKLVKNGCKGIWRDPLGPGKHALNPKTCSYNLIPTTQVVLSWANAESAANAYDKNLSTITLRTADAFDVNMDVQVMFHIPMEKASAVVADLGSMTDMISQVLEPLVSSYFRNAAQSINALDLYTKRAELAKSAKEQISAVLAHYHIESRDVMITDVILPETVTKPVNAAAIAVQEEKQYKSEQAAQEARKQLEFSRKQADMQEALVESERGIDIADNNAKAAVKRAEGEKKSSILAAEGRAETVKIEADAKAHKVTTEGEAEASITKLKGEAEGAAIEAKGTAQAAAYKLSQEALGADYARLQIIEAIAKNGLKIIPENIFIGGGSDGGGLINQFLGIEMIEKLTGKPFNKVESTENDSAK
jgi:uncharacterized membrane protein YqiK